MTEAGHAVFRIREGKPGTEEFHSQLIVTCVEHNGRALSDCEVQKADHCLVVSGVITDASPPYMYISAKFQWAFFFLLLFL